MNAIDTELRDGYNLGYISALNRFREITLKLKEKGGNPKSDDYFGFHLAISNIEREIDNLEIGFGEKLK